MPVDSIKAFQPRIALLVDLATSFGRRVLEGVHSHPARQNWELLAESWGDVGAADLLEGDAPDGIIFDGQFSEILTSLTDLPCPQVDLSGVGPGSEASSVTADFEQVAQVAAQHLRERGFLNIGFLGIPSSPASAQMERSLGQACSHFARRFERWQTPLDWSGQQKSAGRGLTEWLASLPRPCGVVAADDVAARRLLQACRKLNLRVPQEIAVVGVGDYEMVTIVSDPTLSSVVIPARRIGYLAADCLECMLQGGQARHLKLPAPSLAARRSTDLLAFEDELLREALAWMHQHLTDSVRMPQLAEHLSVSRRLLEHHFQQSLGHGPAEQLRRLRLTRAEQLLRETDLGLASVAKMAGLGTAERLCVLFRRHMDLTPGEYRRMLPPPVSPQFYSGSAQMRK